MGPLMLLGVGQEDTGSDGLAPVGRMPVLLCSKYRLGIELAKSFNTVHAGGSTHPSVFQVWSVRQGAAYQDFEAATVGRLGCQPMAQLCSEGCSPL